MPGWLVLSSLCAAMYAAEGAWVKRLKREGFGPAFLAWAAVTLTTFPTAAAAWLDGAPGPRPGYLGPLAATLALNNAGLLCYFRALAYGEMSLVYPLLALTPVFMLLSTQGITGEFPGAGALAGVVLTTAGCYGLGLDGTSAVSPLRRLWNAPGSRYALATAVLWSFAANFDKAAVEASSRFFHPAVHGALLSVLLLPWALASDRADFRRLRTARGWAGLLVLAAIGTSIVLSQFAALDLAQATYVISVKRTGMVLAVLAGWRLYGEPHGPRRLALSLLVLAGVFLLD